jgi:hypothetical protein
MRMYDDLAEWWPLLSPPSEYAEEAEDLLARLPAVPGATLLELGSGGGSLAAHLKSHFQLTLTDRSPAMLRVSQRVNPECEHLLGDMRSLRLSRLFDVVLIHDAIMYATDPAAVQATLKTAAIHCRVGGQWPSCPTTSGRTSSREPITTATTTRMAAGSGTSSGGMIRIPGTIPISSTTHFSSERPTAQPRQLTTGTWRASSVVRSGWSGSPRPEYLPGARWILQRGRSSSALDFPRSAAFRPGPFPSLYSP